MTECACEIFVLLNLLAFQMHGILLLIDEGYQKAQGSIRRLDEFFAGLRLIFSRFLFQTWEEFIGFIIQDDEPDGYRYSKWRLTIITYNFHSKTRPN